MFNHIKIAAEYIRSDAFRYKGQASCLEIVRLYISSRQFRWNVAFRLMQHAPKALISKLLWKLNSLKRSVQIPPQTKIGYGLKIAHCGPLVVSPLAEIGDNCNLSQFTTIGSNSKQAAVIGDNCYIGPNVCLVENVKVGNEVTIGAGSVVTKDIPDGATAAGNYARVLNFDNPGRYITNRWRRD